MKNLYHYKAELLKVVDGDTFDFRLDLGFDTERKIRVRLENLDAPECRGKNKRLGKLYKAIAKELLENSNNITVNTKKYGGKRGSFRRWVSIVSCDGTDLAYMIKDIIENNNNKELMATYEIEG